MGKTLCEMPLKERSVSHVVLEASPKMLRAAASLIDRRGPFADTDSTAVVARRLVNKVYLTASIFVASM